ncbi:ABC transporter substrate-binding protein [Desulfoluna sp.]|uniref:substrate-binding periplasmic protein n=1 Tax=Desulfoluna sp. TaxID=2045199 RepID=UPI002627D097|nr:ABC transporter substrate-binding protein [Desulfoluna sp.]
MNVMKRICFFLVFLTALCATCSAGEMVINGNGFKEPKSWLEGDTAKGILVDIMNHAGKELGVDFTYKLAPWARAYNLALKGEGGIFGISMTEERLQKFDFSDPVYYDTVVLVVKKGKEFKFEDVKDLSGKRVGTCRGCSFGPEYEKAATFFTLDTDTNNVQRLKKLLAGRIDAAIFSPGVAALNLAIDSDASLTKEMFTVLPKPLVNDANYVAFAKSLNKKAFLAKFNAVIKKGMASGEIDSLVSKY